MSVVPAESIPYTETNLARLNFAIDGHVNISGLIDPVSLVPALEDARGLSSPVKTHQYDGETITPLRLPDPEKKPAMRAVLDGIQMGAELLGQDITPGPGAKYRIELHDRAQGSSGRPYQYHQRFVGMAAFTNLRGQSFHWVESAEDGGWIEYTVHPGDVVFQDLRQRLKQRSHAAQCGDRVEVAIANSRKPASTRSYSSTATSRQNAL